MLVFLAGLNPLNLLDSIPGALGQGLIWGIAAIGIYITYKIMDIADLTVDGSLATGGAVCVMLVTQAKMNIFLAMFIAMLVGMITGLVTGIFHTFMGIPAILAGILTQYGLYSVNLKILGKANQALNVDKYNLIASSRYVKDLNPMKNTILISAVFVICVIAVLYWFFGTEIGAALRATGCNEGMARAQGINTNVTKVLGLMISNGLVALSGAMLCQYQGNADISMGRGAIVIGLAAVVIGGAVFKFFSNFATMLLATVFGAIIYYLVLQVVVWLRIDTDLFKLLSAVVIAVFLAAPYLKSQYFSKNVKAVKEGKNA